ncbi:MAG: UbiA family prenyltransferase [Candidatus Buchananbacteria bacterium]
MIAHLQIVLWALHVLWGLKGIWFSERIRLWRKSINLYLSFLAFTDGVVEQLRSAMACALLSAVYDYDTDWAWGSYKGRNFKTLLRRLLVQGEARQMAMKLFNKDLGHALSTDGLERGSVALLFYRRVINSQWMRKYSDEKISTFGRSLQIIDDLLDLRLDHMAGNTNCFLAYNGNRARKFAQEAHEFLESDFFRKLKEHSRIYKILERKTRKELGKFAIKGVTFGTLWNIGRPTTGIYACLVSFLGFRFCDEAMTMACLLTSLSFAIGTTSIMVFNDYVDRENDRKKGKVLASDYPAEVLKYHWWLGLASVLSLGSLAWFSLPVTIFCFVILIIGDLYSSLRRRVVIQNMVVALCSGAPVLCGMIFKGELEFRGLLVFITLVYLILINEIFKDIEDRKTDKGYKETIATRKNHTYAIMVAVSLSYPASLPIILMGMLIGKWSLLLLIFFPIITWQLAMNFMSPESFHRAMGSMRWMIKALLLILLLT